jgi:PAS domain S-box-containing protein
MTRGTDDTSGERHRAPALPEAATEPPAAARGEVPRAALGHFTEWSGGWGAATIATATTALALVAWLLGGADDETKGLVADVAEMVLGVAPTLLMVRVAALSGRQTRERRAWAWLAGAMFSFVAGSALWLYYGLVGLEREVSWADPAYLAMYPTMFVGLLYLPRGFESRGDRTRFWLDSLTVLVGAGMVLWYFLLRPIALAERTSALSTAVALAYPLGDFVLLFGFTSIALRRFEGVSRPALAMMSAGLLANFLGDVLYSAATLQGEYQSGALSDVFWLSMISLWSVSAHLQYRYMQKQGAGAAAPREEAPKVRFSLLPYLSLAVGYSLLMIVAVSHWYEDGDQPVNGLILGALVLTALTVARQITTVRENLQLVREQAERRGEQRLHMLVQRSSDIIAIVTPEEKFAYLSPSVKRVLGYDDQELAGQPAFAIVHPDDLSRAKATAARLAKGPDETITVEFRCRHKSGTWRTLEAVTQRFTDHAGRKGVLANVRDVTERREMELELRHRVDCERLVAAIAADLTRFAPGNLDERIRTASQALGELFGAQHASVYLRGEDGATTKAYGWTAAELTPIVAEGALVSAETYPWWAARLASFKATHVPRVAALPEEARAEREALEAAGVRSLVAVAMANGESLVGHFGFATVRPEKVWAEDDIRTMRVVGELFVNAIERRRAKESLEKLNEDLEDAVSRRTRQLEEANRELEGEIGERLRVEEALQSAKEELEIKVRERTAELRSANERLHLELAQRTRAEQALERERQQLARRVRERTEDLSRANAELARAARLKDEFLASMSHELRTPLNAVLGLSEALEEQIYGPLDSRQREVLRSVQESGRHLLALINDILDLSKIEAGKAALEPRPVPVGEVCEASLLLVRQQAHKKKLAMTFAPDGRIMVLNVDQRRLKQMLVNLLINAVKFTPEGGAVGLEVAGDAEAGEARFTVWDTGVGIAGEDMGRLFEPFVQLDSSLARQHAGTGLGLALVYRMAEMHGGSVAVESRVGKGSRFTISLPWDGCVTGHAPCQAAGEAGPAPARALEGVPGRPLILLAEDNEGNIETFSDYLLSRGYRLSVARDGEEAVRRAAEERPDLIMMDIQMPGVDGLEATRRIRAGGAAPGVPIVALTALAMTGDRERCLEAGADEYLSKPVSLKQLARIIDARLRSVPSAEVI